MDVASPPDPHATGTPPGPSRHRGVARSSKLEPGCWQSAEVTKTQYYTATSLDGFIADDHNSLDWLFEVDRGRESDTGSASSSPASAPWRWVRRRTSGWWRTTASSTIPRSGAVTTETPRAGCSRIDGCRRSPVRICPSSRETSGAVHETMSEAASGRNIWLVGGGDLVGQFADRGLLDEILVGVAPVTLGGGAPLLPRRLTASHLELVDVRRGGQFARLAYRIRK